ncbi:MAG TPA: hypothetical protein P5110_06500 [Candidatus Omnitrophota bacterium]|nr:hypothetical protein [Candidatus Omnitrophota bacterium]HRZ15139.1 hypothetical protein [Candidatus Omnitrophota bacterium]
MGYYNWTGLLCIVPATILLTISYFVLFAQVKAGNKTLKRFGRFVLVCLWLSAAIVLSTGLYLTVSGKSVFHLMKGKSAWKAHHPWMQGGPMMPGCPRTFCESDGSEMMADPQAGMMGSPAGSSPHGSMMKYHDYDAQGNIILEEQKAETPAKK